MTLNEFNSKYFSRPTINPPATLYVFEDEDSAYSWVLCKYFGSDDHEYQLVMVIQSDMNLEYTIKEKWCKAEVKHFYAVEPDVIVVVVDPQESEGEQ
jgi:hypothetical protein